MHIVIVHQHYLMPGQPGGSRFNEFARMWADAGHRVTVIAGTVNYATGEVPEKYRGHWIVAEQDGPVEVLRCYVSPTYSKGYAGRMWAFFSFIFSSGMAAARIEEADVVVATSPPLIAAIPGWLAARARWRHVPWVFEVRDLWPESAVTTGVLSKGSPLTRGLYSLEAWAYRSAETICVLTPAFREDILARGLARAEKIVFVPNGADLAMFSPGPRDNAVRREMGWGDRFVVMYAGAHGRANAVGQMVEAAELLADDPRILFAMVGDGTERAALEQDARRRKLRNVMFCGPQPKARMPDFVNACDVGAAVLQDNPTFRTVYPNKVFDYMACERPVLLAIDGAARSLVCDDAQAGLFAFPERPAELAAAARRLADDPALCRQLGASGRAWVLANATRQSLAERYLAILEGLAHRGASSGRAIQQARPG